MGLKVTTDMKVFKGKTLVGHNFTKGGEYILYLEAGEGTYERVRIPSYMKDTLEMYWSICQVEDDYEYPEGTQQE